MTASLNGSHRFLALGDSYTIGEGIAPQGRWPVQVARRLRARGIAIEEPVVIARTGWTTDELATAMDCVDFEPPYALVTLLIGVNDQYRNRDVAGYSDAFEALLGRAITLAGDHANHVVVVSIPDWGVTGFARAEGRDAAGIAAAIDAFNGSAADITRALGAAFVDITGLSRDAGDDHAMLVADRLHPSAAQYAIWTQAIVPAAADAVASSSDVH